MNDFLFDSSDVHEQEIAEDRPTWKVLIADDEPSIHQVTQFVVDGIEVLGRDIELISVYTGSDAKKVMAERDDIALAILDVVMEEPDAGLDVVRFIRDELHNNYTRIVLRTGQPGEAPEDTVIRDYDINDYKEKTELTSSKLKTLLYSALRSYRDICTISNSRKGLEKTILSISEVNRSQSLKQLSSAILSEITNLLGASQDALMVHHASAYTVNVADGRFRVLAGAGELQGYVETDDVDNLPSDVSRAINKAFREKRSYFNDNAFVGYSKSSQGCENVVYLEADVALSNIDSHLIKIFAAQVTMSYENLLLKEEIQASQRELMHILAGAVESKSKETGAHVERVAKISKLLALYAGLNEFECEQILMATPLHDVGKVAIPDVVLNKPGKLDLDEWSVMQEHAQIGEELLMSSKTKTLQLAAIIAGQHHEKWDGTGYPRGIQGEDIHIAARITAIADVIDALCSKRCYKDSWDYPEVLALLSEQKGKHFDPDLIDIALEHFDEIKEIRDMHPDEF